MAGRTDDEFGGEPARNSIDPDRVLDACRELIMAVGPARVTMANVARQAKVSRATIYRRWSNIDELVADVVGREWMTMATLVVPDPESNLRVQLVDTVVGISRATRENAMWKRIIEMDPSFLVNFLLKRRGANAEFQLQLMEFHLRRGMLETTIRKGEPTVMAEAILAVAISFVLGVPVAASDPDALDGELSRLINRYLMP